MQKHITIYDSDTKNWLQKLVITIKRESKSHFNSIFYRSSASWYQRLHNILIHNFCLCYCPSINAVLQKEASIYLRNLHCFSKVWFEASQRELELKYKKFYIRAEWQIPKRLKTYHLRYLESIRKVPKLGRDTA